MRWILFFFFMGVQGVQAEPFRIITYNVWHGLNGTGTVKFGDLEPQGRKEKRVAWQIEQIKNLRPDLILMQEVNPVRELAGHYASELGMEEIHQVDQCGLKLFGFGLPTNLNTGLAILARPGLKLRKISGLRLSGSWFGWCSNWSGFQFSEFRYALIGEITAPWGRTVVANAHVHHGPAITSEFVDRMQALVVQEKITPSQLEEVKRRMLDGMTRRMHEVEFLLKNIESLRPEREPVIMGGDFNDVPGSETITRITNREFVDVYAAANPGRAVYTWDSQANRINHEMTKYLEPPVPYFNVKELLELLRQHDLSPRQLDYVFVSTELSAKIFGGQLIMNGAQGDLIGSDHFGLMTSLNP